MKYGLSMLGLLCVVLVCVPTSVEAAPCLSNVCSAPVVSSYVAPTYNTALVAVLPAIFVPAASYTIGVSAPVPTVQTTTTTQQTASIGSTAVTQANTESSVMLELLKEMRAMRTEQREFYASFKSGQPVQPNVKKDDNSGLTPQQKADVEAAVAVFKKPFPGTNVSCQTCHSKNEPSIKSGDFHLFDESGNSLAVSEDLAKAMYRKVSRERKCPGSPSAWTGEEKDAILKVLPKSN